MVNSLCQFFLNLSILVLLLVSVVSADSFSYDDQDNWDHEYRQCGGKLQSPINIKSSSAIIDENLELHLQHYTGTIDYGYYWINDGHTIKLVKADTTIDSHTLTGNAVDYGHYRFKQLHFHWGERNDVGSEHKVDGIGYPLELHLVHQTIESGHRFAHANKFVVLSVFFTLGRKNEILNNLVESTNDLMVENKKLMITHRNHNYGNFGIIDFLPDDLESFYVYNGSLTTPPCNETVRWIIFKRVHELSEDQLNSIRSIFRPKILSNSRNNKALNSRLVFTSDDKPMSRELPNISSALSRISLNTFSYLSILLIFLKYTYSVLFL